MKKIMSKRKAIIVVLGLLLIYGTKPDKGGVWACTKTFDLSELSEIELDHKPFWTWELFESAKYRFHITPEEFLKLQSLLASDGYSDWQTHGLTFGSVSVGHSGSDDFIVCKKRINRMQYYWSYSRELNVVYAISWRN